MKISQVQKSHKSFEPLHKNSVKPVKDTDFTSVLYEALIRHGVNVKKLKKR